MGLLVGSGVGLGGRADDGRSVVVPEVAGVPVAVFGVHEILAWYV